MIKGRKRQSAPESVPADAESAPEIPEALPARVLSREIKLAKYVLFPFGLACDTVGDVTLDSTIALIQPHPENSFYLCPLTPHPQPTESLAWYYADCIAYEHEIPVIVCPTGFSRFGYHYIHSGPSRPQERTIIHVESGQTTNRTVNSMPATDVAKLFYAEQLCRILDEVRELRHGPLTYVRFRYTDTGNRLDLPYSSSYARAANGVHLYAAGLRQADTLAEFLCYYRVVESVTDSNGKVWIGEALHRLRRHNFGFVPIAHQQDRSPRNVLAIYRYRALRRLATLLKQHGSYSKIATHLYKVDRCGIAHGKTIVRADIVPSYFEMVRDTYLMKLLARLAIDEKVAPPAGKPSSRKGEDGRPNEALQRAGKQRPPLNAGR
jgi:hypothetical protein